MGQESKEWVNAIHRSRKTKSGGIFVYVDSQTLRDSGLPTDKPLLVKRYPTKSNTNVKQIVLRFKVKDNE